MWALRRASNPLKFRHLGVGTSHVCCATTETLYCCVEGKASIFESFQPVNGECLFHHPTNFCSNFYMSCGLSSQAGAESSESDDELEDGFSQLRTPAGANSNEINRNEDELISEHEQSDDENDVGEQFHNAVELADGGADPGEKSTSKKNADSELFKVIVAAPHSQIRSVLDKRLVNGKQLDRDEISLAMLNLRKRRMYSRALQLSEWLEANKRLDFVERDYASRLDLIAKTYGLYKAESYIQKIPESFRGEVIYRTLLANCVSAKNLKKAEDVFKKMKDLKFPITAFSCDQLLLLYKRLDKKKIADVLLLMEKENVKPTLFTYKLLIDSKGQSNDITGMDQIVETMKASGFEPDINIKATLAKHYVSSGLKEKAEGILKDIEGGNLQQHCWDCRILLPLYAALGQANEVGRIWKVCESSMQPEDCIAAIKAWGMLNKIDEAEAVFDKMTTTWKKLSSRHYSVLLRVYANHKMLAKGKNLFKRMADNGYQIGPLTWDALIKLYVEAGEVEKADSILRKAAQQNQVKPMFHSYMVIMDHYSNRGAIHNAEKIFHQMRQAGYVIRMNQYNSLIQTYINAKAPAYGIRERMKADNIFPNKALAGRLALVDAFRKTAVSDLID